jgi:hypothetical protein
MAALVTVLLPGAAAADMVSPGFSRVPHHLVIEVAGDHPGYQFWLVSPRGAEPLEVAPDRPYRVDGAGRDGSHRIGYVVAVPSDIAWRLKAAELAEVVASGKLPPGVLRSDPIDFYGAVPFYDSRREVIDTYRLELVPGERVSLVWLGQNAGSRWVKASWASAGVFAALGLVWGGYRLLRRNPSLSRQAEPLSWPTDLNKNEDPGSG